MDKPTKPMPFVDGLRIFLPAILLGPPIGGFLFGLGGIILGILPWLFESAGVNENDQGASFGIILLPLITALWSYALGAIPAGLSAVGLAIHCHLTQSISFPRTLGWITLVTLLYVAYFFAGSGWEYYQKTLVFTLMLLGCGLIAGWLLYKWFAPGLSYFEAKPGNGA